MPAAGLAKRMRGIPKFLLPANIDYLSLLEIHIDNIKDSFNDIYLATRPEIVPLIKSLDHNFKNMNILEMDTSTMSETILETLEVSKEDFHLLVMPDTFFLGEKPYLELDQTPEVCELACWKIRDEQRGKLGEVSSLIGFHENNIINMEIVDKKKDYIEFIFDIQINDLKNYKNLISELKLKQYKFSIIRHRKKDALLQRIFKNFKRN